MHDISTGRPARRRQTAADTYASSSIVTGAMTTLQAQPHPLAQTFHPRLVSSPSSGITDSFIVSADARARSKRSYPDDSCDDPFESLAELAMFERSARDGVEATGIAEVVAVRGLVRSSEAAASE